jgi:hypothetical protein
MKPDDQKPKSSPDISDILEGAGYTVVEGAESVLRAIRSCSDGEPGKLCSGYRVFPDGEKCGGCKDCENDSK